MSEKKHPSCRDIARHAGVSGNTVSLALRNSHRISPATRQLVLRTAAEIGYTPDPRLKEYMRYIRHRRRTKNLPVLALVNVHSQPLARLTSPNIRGIAAAATREAARQGYRLEEFRLENPEMTPARLSDILEARGIRGVVILPLPAGCSPLDFNWPAFVAVTTCYSAYRMGLNLVTTNRQHYLELALAELRSLGYKRIGLAMDDDTDNRSHHQTLAHFLWDQSLQSPRTRVPPLLAPALESDNLGRWLRRERPDAVVSTRNHVCGLIRGLGWKIPMQIGFASLAASARDVPHLAGVDERPADVGVSAIDLLVAQLQREEFGLPVTRRLLLVEGSWIPGGTVRVVSQPATARRSGLRATTKPH